MGDVLGIHKEKKTDTNSCTTAKGAEKYKHHPRAVCCVKIGYIGIKLTSP